MRHRFVHQVGGVARRVLATTLKTAISSLVLGFSLMMLLRYLGIPVPSPYELLNNMERLILG